MRERVSLIITGVMLAISLSAGILAAHAAIGAVKSFQQERVLTQEGDVRTIRPWMTVPYIARVYRVPAPYLYQNLKLSTEEPMPHTTLHALATHTREPVDLIIHRVQAAILKYRKVHPTPTPEQKPHKGLKKEPGEEAI